VSWPQGGGRESNPGKEAGCGWGRAQSKTKIDQDACRDIKAEQRARAISRLNSERARGEAVVGAGHKARPAGGCQTHQWGHILLWGLARVHPQRRDQMSALPEAGTAMLECPSVP
jgi:hypothetical protein